jgi:hypothetical protein
VKTADKAEPRRLTPAEQQWVDEVIAIVEGTDAAGVTATLDRIVALAREIEREKASEYERGVEDGESAISQRRGDESDWVATRGGRS